MLLRVRRPYDCLPTHAGSPEGKRMKLFDSGGKKGEAEGYIATTIYSLCLSSFCNEMACVIEAYPNNGPIQPGQQSLSRLH